MRRALSVLVLVPLLLAAAACGDDDSGASGGGGTDQDAAEATTTTAEPEPRPSAGCGSSSAAAVTEEEHTLTVGGTSRRFLLTVPSGHDGETPVPLVFDIHGIIEGADIHAEMSQYSVLAEEEGFVVVFPHGTGDPVRWDLEVDEGNPDIEYFDAVLEEVSSSLCIDESRVYATGLSMGAMFTSVLLCTRADVMAAAAPVAGLLDPEGCEPSRPVPILTFHGTADPIVLFTGGLDLSQIGAPEGTGPTTTRPEPDLDGPGYPANVAAWAERNGCEPEPTDDEVTAEVIHRVYDCPAGADVEFDIVVGGGHSWPNSEFSRQIERVVGHTTSDVDATRDGWEFLSQFTNPG